MLEVWLLNLILHSQFLIFNNIVTTDCLEFRSEVNVQSSIMEVIRSLMPSLMGTPAVGSPSGGLGHTRNSLFDVDQVTDCA